MPNLLQIAARKLAKKETPATKDSELELAMDEFQNAKSAKDKAEALKAFMALVKEED